MKKPIPFGKYYLLERINVGGMAEVFRAKAYGVEGFERLLAVKRILPNIAEDQEFITMFIDEAKIAVQLNHANIAQIFDLGVVDGSYFIAMEHIHGRDMRAIFERCRQRNEPMPIAQSCFMAMKMCEGLDYAHNKRDQGSREMALVHRDVSPQNVIVSFEGEVKIIDFGIAKAAGKMGKTQAGILKGKFGYMSPEQVRGLPIDRRSDIFSTGIVLYELLTNERLFVGESDFSTLEKVRNVEILPPSTYNRKIPEELERIVLKALAKDVDDRYQNAIDLHDELQAFVYTAGEFYSRKDLAAWMKRTFVKEIEEETAKLEQYRQLAPPEVRPPTANRGAQQTPAPQQVARRPTIGMAAIAPPPPPPGSMNGRAGGTVPPPVAGAAVAAPAAKATKPPGPKPPGAKPPAGHKREDQTNELEWDDEELETQIYDTPDGQPPGFEAEAAALAAAPVEPSAAAAENPPRRPSGDQQQAVRRTAGGMATAGEPVATSRQTSPPPVGVQTIQGFGSANGSHAPSALGSGQTPQPFSSSLSGSPAPSPFPPPPIADEPSAIVSMAKLGAQRPVIETSAPLSPQVSWRSSRMPVIAAVVGVLVLGGGAGLYFALAGNSNPPAAKVAPVTPAAGSNPGGEGGAPVGDPPSGGAGAGGSAAVAPPGPTGPADPKSGFEVWTVPPGATVKLDGAPVKGQTPFALTNLTVGKHTIEVSLPGYQPSSQEAQVEAGKTSRLDFKLAPFEAVAHFASEPPGAKVTIVAEGGAREIVGQAPADWKLDPTKKYEIVFEKDGYVTVTRAVDPSVELVGGKSELTIAVVLERAQIAAVPDRGPRKPDVVRDPPREPAPKDPLPKDPRELVVKDPPKDPEPKDPPKDPPREPAVAGTGTLMLGAKPQCKIYIDGKDTGLVTPQRSLDVKVGVRRITLVNNEFNIKETFSIEVKPGQTEKVIKDFSDRIPQ